jgi:preprotein translocase subunit SecD
LIVSGVLTYGCLVVLGNQIGFTLTLAGIAGFIVAIGITADSFVVFFERIKDEVHDGRTFRVAVPRAWVRARRTILSADTVSFLAAAILYYFAAGDVRGFAFALGLSTILDLVVVFLFTHPLISLLSRSKAFGSARFTGLDSVRAGGVAGEVATPAEPARVKPSARRGQDAAAAAARAAAPEAATGGGVAVLDDEEAEEPEVQESPRTRKVSEPSSEAVETAEPPPPSDSAEPDRPRTPPKPGSAAERAAARRAKMKAERGQG